VVEDESTRFAMEAATLSAIAVLHSLSTSVPDRSEELFSAA
jgi:hypothetical protein